MVVSQAPQKRIAGLFSRQARFYDSEAKVQNVILQKLAERLRSVMKKGEIWCDVGGGTGRLFEYASPLPEKSVMICLDLAFGSLRIAAGPVRGVPAVNGDVQRFPFRDSVLDGIAMASMLQWVPEPLEALKQAVEKLKASGPIIFSVFTEGSFNELHSVRLSKGMSVSTWFPAEDELLSLFRSAGIEMEEDTKESFSYVQYFSDAFDALKSLSRIGGSAVSGPLLNRGELIDLCRQYESRYATSKGIPVTYNALIGCARRI